MINFYIMNTVRIGSGDLSRIGLGCGGFSRLGQDGESVVKTAFEQGIRFFDTAEAYNTESFLGKGLTGSDRSELTLCSKVSPREEGLFRSAALIRRSLEKTLENLNTDRLDIYYVHGVVPEDYSTVKKEIFPVLSRLKEEGLIGKIGITEMFGRDTEHAMMAQAVGDGIWDAVMVGYNLLNQSGAELLRAAGEKGMFRVNMFAVRQALINNEVFGIYMDRMIREGQFGFSLCEFYEFKDELFRGRDSVSLPGLAYRFVRDEDLFDVILTGTGNVEHLKDNVMALSEPALSDRIRDLLRTFFSGETRTSGQEGFFS